MARAMLIAGGMVVAGAAVFFALPTGVSMDVEGPSTALVVGQDAMITITVRNRHPLRSITIDSIELSCGCVQLSEGDKGPFRIGGWGERTVQVVARPGPVDDEVRSTAAVFANGRALAWAEVQGDVRPVFAGWPERAEVQQGPDGNLRLAIDPVYEQRVRSAALFKLGAEEPMQVGVLDHSTIVFGGENAQGQHADELVLQLDAVRWAGRLQVKEN
ncbi:MAG: hypothetical protein KDA20_12220 [Phycisphaerales bacterium]|nr:hypothetical protein [Phycisphaerales bacterium]